MKMKMKMKIKIKTALILACLLKEVEKIIKNMSLLSGVRKMIDMARLLFTDFVKADLSNFKKKMTKEKIGREVYVLKWSELREKTKEYMPNIDVEFWANRKNDLLTVDAQISLPSLFFGSNIFEHKDNDYEKVVTKSVETLNNLGLFVTEAMLRKAILRAVSFCKNIVLPSGFTADDFILSLSRLDMGKCYQEPRRKDYYEEVVGRDIKFYNRSIGIGWYDKMHQLVNLKPEYRTPVEEEIVRRFKEKKGRNNIVRFEVTLQRKDVVRERICSKLGLSEPRDLTLKDVFNQKLAKEILLEKFNRLFDETNVKPLSLGCIPIETPLRQLKGENRLSLLKSFSVLGACVFVGQKGTVLARQVLDEISTPNERRRFFDFLKNHLKGIDIKSYKLGEMLELAKKQMEDFEPLIRPENLNPPLGIKPQSISLI
jgi:hypothetical protein